MHEIKFSKADEDKGEGLLNKNMRTSFKDDW